MASSEIASGSGIPLNSLSTVKDASKNNVLSGHRGTIITDTESNGITDFNDSWIVGGLVNRQVKCSSLFHCSGILV